MKLFRGGYYGLAVGILFVGLLMRITVVKQQFEQGTILDVSWVENKQLKLGRVNAINLRLQNQSNSTVKIIGISDC